MNEPLAYRMPSDKELKQQISDGDKLIGAMEVIVKILQKYQKPTGDIFIREKDWDALTAPYLKQSKMWKLKE
jgi:hypothetical protein